MKYLAWYRAEFYRGIYGSKDDGIDRRYMVRVFDAGSDAEANDRARKEERERYELSRLFAIDHEVSLPRNHQELNARK